ncbi:RagB/SusD family nutrient uptake outer membrane protein [Dysgonomonas sp. Marseille-P4677]|uniref:RagB/SusD family nutrient uptake outer membrane protein n=1 Tax=Dysgonomonas sp. Marseille-P4677 TaxID=2364790 RepID=UPI001912C130|nr:RagB/SusD family nutrient uptake outer membrane protein [Dysgonomonas sp. Marseille-P4677]MBK5719612.1 RagB/SusD family nutrient uptake outer membrane protein [Dysgonomonas sp. Marseille-P4677]
MNKINKYARLLIFTLLITSCSGFLDEESKKNPTEETVYSDIELIESVVGGIYSSWNDLRSDEQGLILMMGTDEVQQGAFQMKDNAQRGSFDRFDGNLNADLNIVSSQWDARWPMINEAAKVIRGIEYNYDLTEGSKAAEIYGEASFLRAFFTFEMTMYWGEIPIKDKSREAELGDGRQPLTDIWNFIIADLNNAAKFLPESNGVGRANKWAAWATLGKVYMSAPEETGLRDFGKAIDCFEQMMDKYTLVNFADLFDYNKPNTAESILALQYNNVYPSNNKIQFQVGSRAVQSFFGDGCYFSGYDKIVPTEFAYETVANEGLWEDGDLRKNESIRYDFTYNGVTPDYSNILWEGLGADHDELKPHIKKYEDYRTDNKSGNGINNMWYSGKNIHILRLGDIKLCYAECLSETGRVADAANVVNEVRARAWGGTLPSDKAWSSMSKDEFRNRVMDERIRELFAEYWRRIDLIRTGKYVELVKKRNRWTRESNKIQSYHMRLPIPTSEIERNPDMTKENQNPGYN